MEHSLKTHLLIAFGCVLSSCGTQTNDQSQADRHEVVDAEVATFELNGIAFSLPIGSDGFIMPRKQSVSWGFDPAVWNKTVGSVGAKNAVPPASWAVTGWSGLPDQRTIDILEGVGLNPVTIGGREGYRPSSDSMVNPPVYFFDPGVDGFAQCGTSGGVLVPGSYCELHIVNSGVHHHFPLPQEQIDHSPEIASVFLRVVMGE